MKRGFLLILCLGILIGELQFVYGRKHYYDFNVLGGNQNIISDDNSETNTAGVVYGYKK